MEERVADYGDGRSIAYGISFFCDHGGCGLVWFGLVWFCDWEVEVDLHLRSFEPFSIAISCFLCFGCFRSVLIWSPTIY